MTAPVCWTFGIERRDGHPNPSVQMNTGIEARHFEIEIRAADVAGESASQYEYTSTTAKTPAEAVKEIASRPPNKVGQTQLREVDDQR